MKEIRGRCLKVVDHDNTTGKISVFVEDLSNRSQFMACGPARRMIANQGYLLWGNEEQDGTFQFTGFRRMAVCYQESVDMLSDRVAGITRAMAESIVSRLGDDIFAYTKNENIEKALCEVDGIGPKKAEAIHAFIRAEQDDDEIYNFLSEYEVPYEHILSVISAFPDMKPEQVTADPYTLLKCGVPFPYCDLIGIRNGIDPWDLKRVRAAIWEVFRIMQDRGDTRMEYGKFLRQVSSFAYHNGKSPIQIPESLTAIITEASAKMKLYDDSGIRMITTMELFTQEEAIRGHLKRLTASAVKKQVDLDRLISEVESRSGMSFNEEQRQAFTILENGGAAMLLGGPGTGKTTTISGIVNACLTIDPKCRILLCAPTGRAASRMSEISALKAKTMHKSLDLKWFDHDAMPSPLEYDFIIVDEMSMCDTSLFAKFLSAVRSGVPLLLAGDYNQIPSVGPGQVLRDLAESGKLPVTWLTRNIRQKDGSGIHENAVRILNGDVPENAPDFEIRTVANDQEIVDAIRALDTADLPQVLCPIKKTKAGVWGLNNIIQQKRDLPGKGLWINGTKFLEGDHVIMNTNDYEHDYMNGDVGEIKKIQGGILHIQFPDRLLILTAKEADGMTLSYALTFHKSQGAECDRALVILPEGAGCMASRELLYTAVTRAKQKVTLLAVDGMLDRYLSDKHRHRRECGLSGFLNGTVQDPIHRAPDRQ